MTEKEMPKFEEVFKKLEDCAEKMDDPTLPLEDAIKAFEEGTEHYKICEEILNSAKQRIELIGESSES